MALTKIGAGLFKDTLKSSVSGALGDNATTIRNLTSAGITGSFSPASASISTRLTTAESELSNTLISSSAQIANDISGSLSSTAIASLGASIVSASVLSSPSQGTIRLATNGVNNDVDSGLQAGDSPTFAGGTVTGNLTVGGTLTAQEIHTEFTSASIMFSSGSTKFGDTIDDTHEVTGSMTMSGSVTVNDGNLTVTDDLSVDGTTNLDNTDIDGTLTVDGGNIVFNEDSADQDFRVESNGNANMLFVDGGQNAVGIGTNNAGASGEKLLIIGNDNQNFLVVSSSNDDNFLSIGTFENDQAIIGFGNKATTPTDLNFYAANRPPIGGSNLVMSLSGSGHVIVPQGPLEVGQHGVAGGQIVSDGDLAIHAGFNDSSTGNGDIIFKSFGESTSAVELARVTSTGRFGINSNNPDEELEVFGATDVGIKLRATGTTSTAGSHVPAISFQSNQGDGVTARASISADRDGAATKGALIFSPRVSDNITEVMRINGSGNVGIGTNNPGYKLEVADATNPQIAVTDTTNTVTTMLRALDDQGYVGTQTNHPIKLVTNGTIRATIANNGPISFTEDVTIGTGRELFLPDGEASNPSIRFTDDTDTGFYRGGDGAITFMNNGNRSLELQSSLRAEFRGEIRTVGSTNSDFGNEAFRTKDSSNNDGVRIQHGGGNGQILLYSANSHRGTIDANKFTSHTNGQTLGSTANEGVVFLSNNTERMRITNGGGVGIGTNNPSARLHVEDANSNAPLVIFELTGGGGKIVAFVTNNTENGDISEAAGTVSLNGFQGAHQTNIAGSSDTTIKEGTVISTTDNLYKLNHPQCKISDTENDTRVYGVLSRYVSGSSDFVVASVGVGAIRVTGSCAGGDLLVSAGDGCAKVNNSATLQTVIGKVTSNTSGSMTEDRLIPCVLYCG